MTRPSAARSQHTADQIKTAKSAFKRASNSASTATPPNKKDTDKAEKKSTLAKPNLKSKSGVSNTRLRKLSLRSGVKRVSAHACNDARRHVHAFLDRLIEDAVAYAKHASRRTLMVADVAPALERQGRISFGGNERRPIETQSRRRPKSGTVSVGE